VTIALTETAVSGGVSRSSLSTFWCVLIFLWFSLPPLLPFFSTLSLPYTLLTLSPSLCLPQDSNIWMSLVPRVNELCHICELVTIMRASYHNYECVVAHTWMSHATYEWIVSQVWMSHVPDINYLFPAYQSHVTHECACREYKLCFSNVRTSHLPNLNEQHVHKCNWSHIIYMSHAWIWKSHTTHEK